MKNRTFKKILKTFFLICTYTSVFVFFCTISSDAKSFIAPIDNSITLYKPEISLKQEEVSKTSTTTEFKNLKQMDNLLDKTKNGNYDILNNFKNIFFLDEDENIMFNIRDIDVSSDIELICRVINAETSTASYEEMLGTANIILNRQKLALQYNNLYPSSIKEIIFAKDQFNCVLGGDFNYGNNRFFEPYSINVLKAAVEAKETDVTSGAVEYACKHDKIDLLDATGRVITTKIEGTTYIGLSPDFIYTNFSKKSPNQNFDLETFIVFNITYLFF